MRQTSRFHKQKHHLFKCDRKEREKERGKWVIFIRINKFVWKPTELKSKHRYTYSKRNLNKPLYTRRRQHKRNVWRESSLFWFFIFFSLSSYRAVHAEYYLPLRLIYWFCFSRFNQQQHWLPETAGIQDICGCFFFQILADVTHASGGSAFRA